MRVSPSSSLAQQRRPSRSGAPCCCSGASSSPSSRRRRRRVVVSSTSSSSPSPPTDAYSYSNPSDAAAFVAAASSLRKDQRVRRPENAPGAFFVDSSCINCDVCRKLAPDTFWKAGPQSAVRSQPPLASASSLLQSDPVAAAAAAALVSCPTASIHAEGLRPSDVAAAAAAFLPCAVPGVAPASEGGPRALFLGYTSGKSFGASSYLLLREKGGNIMVDSPRFDPRLAAKIEALGGARWIFLTHRDDVADHARWAERLRARRIMHSLECNERQGTDAVEAKLEGEGPWTLRDCRGEGERGGDGDGDDDAGDDGEVQFVLQPGHTEACVAMFHAPSRALFSGDVISCGSDAGWFSEDGSPRLHAYRDFCWFSFSKLLDSVESGLRPLGFLHLLPGHGRSGSWESLEKKDAAVDELLSRERAVDAAAA